MDSICSAHNHIFDPIDFEVTRKIIKGKEKIIIDVKEFEIQMEDNKIEAAKKELDFKAKVRKSFFIK